MKRRILKYVLIGLTLLVLGGLWAFSTFFFNPFEGKYAYDLASLIPRLTAYRDQLPKSRKKERRAIGELIAEIDKLTSLDQSALAPELKRLRNTTLRKRLTALLLARSAEIQRSDPERAAAFGLTLIMSTLDSVVLFGEYRTGSLAFEDDELAAELTTAYLAYLGIPVRSNR